MEELAKNILDKFESLLRTIVPGAIFLAALMLTSAHNAAVQFLGEFGWLWAAVAVLVGVTLYGIHFAILEDISMFLVLFIRMFWDSRARKNPIKLMKKCYRERWSRLAAADDRAKVHQNQLDRRYSWLIFLYCSGSAFWVAGIFLYQFNFPQDEFRTLFATGGDAWFLAILADIRITGAELWLNDALPQNADLPE
jgi:hypothetical protein